MREKVATCLLLCIPSTCRGAGSEHGSSCLGNAGMTVAQGECVAVAWRLRVQAEVDESLLISQARLGSFR